MNLRIARKGSYSKARLGGLLVLVALLGLGADAGGFEIFDVADCENCETDSTLQSIDLSRFILRLQPGESDVLRAFTTDEGLLDWLVSPPLSEGFFFGGFISARAELEGSTRGVSEVDVKVTLEEESRPLTSVNLHFSVGERQPDETKPTVASRDFQVVFLPRVRIGQDKKNTSVTAFNGANMIVPVEGTAATECTWALPVAPSLPYGAVVGLKVERFEVRPDALAFTVTADPAYLDQMKQEKALKLDWYIKLEGNCPGSSKPVVAFQPITIVSF